MRVQFIFGRWLANDWDEFTAINAAALVDFLNREQRSAKLGLFDDRHRASAREQNADAPRLPSRFAPRTSHHRAAPPISVNCSGLFPAPGRQNKCYSSYAVSATTLRNSMERL